MWMSVRRAVRVCVVVRMDILLVPVNIELHAADARLLTSRNMDVPAVKLEFFQFAFERMNVNAQVDHRAEKHVATDAAKDVEVKHFHKRQVPGSNTGKNPNTQLGVVLGEHGPLRFEARIFFGHWSFEGEVLDREPTPAAANSFIWLAA